MGRVVTGGPDPPPERLQTNAPRGTRPSEPNPPGRLQPEARRGQEVARVGRQTGGGTVILALVLAALSMGGQSITDEPGVVLEMEVAGGEVRANGPVFPHLPLANRGPQPLWLNERLRLNTPFAPPSHRELTLSVV